MVREESYFGKTINNTGNLSENSKRADYRHADLNAFPGADIDLNPAGEWICNAADDFCRRDFICCSGNGIDEAPQRFVFLLHFLITCSRELQELIFFGEPLHFFIKAALAHEITLPFTENSARQVDRLYDGRCKAHYRASEAIKRTQAAINKDGCQRKHKKE